MKKTKKAISTVSRSRKRKPKDKFAREGLGDEKRARYLAGVEHIDFNDHDLLKKFMTEHGKIMPRRITGTSSKQQRQLKRAIRHARVLGLVCHSVNV